MNREQAPAWLPTYLVPFFTLSYPVDTPAKPDSFPNSNYYVNGPLDLCFIVMWIGALALIRDGLRLKVFEPFARQWHLRAERNAAARRAKRNATKSTPTSEKSSSPEYKTIRQSKQDVIRERNVMRFGEQSYQWIYFVVYWSYGAYLHFNFPHSPWRLEYLWIDYPFYPSAGCVKFYYLSQLGYWIHSVLVLNAEAHRKDHVQMMTHHVVTITLIMGSYFANDTRIGCLILFLMDWCDIWLAFAKMLRYLGFTSLCDVVFGFFMISWVATRQIGYFIVLWSVFNAQKYRKYGWIPEKGHYLIPITYWPFMIFLATLGVMMCIWSSIMFSIAYNVARGKPAEDTRSDDELDAAGTPETDDSDDDDDDHDGVGDTVSVVEPVSLPKKDS